MQCMVYIKPAWWTLTVTERLEGDNDAVALHNTVITLRSVHKYGHCGFIVMSTIITAGSTQSMHLNRDDGLFAKSPCTWRLLWTHTLRTKDTRAEVHLAFTSIFASLLRAASC